MSVDQNGSRPAGDRDLPTDPERLEAEIEERRRHLAETLDELLTRASPKQIARRGALHLREGVVRGTRTPEGGLRAERVAALGLAALVCGGLVFWAWRRRGAR